MTPHRRDNEEDIFNHSRDSDSIPRWLHWTLVSINRCGFPIVAFFFMWYFATVSLKHITENMGRQSLSLEALIVTINSNHVESKEWRSQVMENIRELRNNIGKK